MLNDKAPKVGDLIRIKGWPVGTVTSVEGDLCYRTYLEGEPLPFIWRLYDRGVASLNTVHWWPGKE